MRASYREIPELIRGRVPFKGNSLRAEKREPGDPTPDKGRGELQVPEGADYVIWSYATPIGFAIGSELYVTAESFSVTTSRAQNILRALGASEINPKEQRQ